MKREHQINILYIVAVFMAVLAIHSYFGQVDHLREIPYSEFLQL